MCGVEDLLRCGHCAFMGVVAVEGWGTRPRDSAADRSIDVTEFRQARGYIAGQELEDSV